MQNSQNSGQITQVCTEPSTFPHLIEKGIDVIADNPQAVFTVSLGIAIAIGLYGLGKGISTVISQLND
jgi:hypothetical protein